MTTIEQVQDGTVRVAGAELYCERRGAGPAVLCVTGASGDAGVLAGLADRLAEDYTVVTYDRRGSSRSPRPPGWTTTSSAEQAGDAAGLVEAFEALDPEQRERQLDNGETFFGVEFGALESQLPDDDRLAAVTVPVRVLAGVDTAPPFFAEAAAWVAERLGVTVSPSPGAHTPAACTPASPSAWPTPTGWTSPTPQVQSLVGLVVAGDVVEGGADAPAHGPGLAVDEHGGAHGAADHAVPPRVGGDDAVGERLRRDRDVSQSGDAQQPGQGVLVGEAEERRTGGQAGRRLGAGLADGGDHGAEDHDTFGGVPGRQPFSVKLASGRRR
jgi:hypothetical protein